MKQKIQMKKFFKSNQKKLKIPVTEGIKIIFFIIVMGAILGSVAPFIHIFYPKTAHEVLVLNIKYEEGKITKAKYLEDKKVLKKKYETFGFSTKRRFLFAIGLPLALFCCSMILLYVSQFITNSPVKRGSIFAGLSFQFTAIYFIVWTLWAYTYEEKDFSKSAYYSIIVLSSILMTFTIYQFQKSISHNNSKIRELIGFIVGTRKSLFNTIEKHETETAAITQKEEFDQKMYETFEKVVD